MIKSWKHKGLRAFYMTGVKSGIQPSHARRLKVILQLLNAITKPEDMNIPGMDFHSLRGNFRGYYSVVVRANWKVIFKVEDSDVVLVNYLDYH